MVYCYTVFIVQTHTERYYKMAKKLTLEQQVQEEHIQELLAFQFNDNTDSFTIRKSFEIYMDQDVSIQDELVKLFVEEGGFKNVTYPMIRAAVFANCDIDRVYNPANLFEGA